MCDFVLDIIKIQINYPIIMLNRFVIDVIIAISHKLVPFEDILIVCPIIEYNNQFVEIASPDLNNPCGIF